MKKYNLMTSLLAATLGLFGAMLFGSSSVYAAFRWNDAQTLVKSCAVQPVKKLPNGKTEFAPIQSYCPELLTVNGQEATLVLQGTRYFATLRESDHADGGDLNDLVITNLQGKVVASANNLLAFGDVLLALVGGDTDLPQIEE